MKSLYSKRIIKFFRYFDNENSQRVFHEIQIDKKYNTPLETIKKNYLIIIIIFLVLIKTIKK